MGSAQIKKVDIVFLNDDQGTLYFVEHALKHHEHCNDESVVNTVNFLSELGDIRISYSYADIYIEETGLPKTIEELDSMLE